MSRRSAIVAALGAALIPEAVALAPPMARVEFRIALDTRPLQLILDELSMLFAEAPEAIAHSLADVCDDGAAKLLELSEVAAGGATNLCLVSVAPSRAAIELVMALRAREYERFAGHWNGLMAGVATASVGRAAEAQQ